MSQRTLTRLALVFILGFACPAFAKGPVDVVFTPELSWTRAGDLPFFTHLQSQVSLQVARGPRAVWTERKASCQKLNGRARVDGKSFRCTFTHVNGQMTMWAMSIVQRIPRSDEVLQIVLAGPMASAHDDEIRAFVDERLLACVQYNDARPGARAGSVFAGVSVERCGEHVSDDDVTFDEAALAALSDDERAYLAMQKENGRFTKRARAYEAVLAGSRLEFRLSGGHESYGKHYDGSFAYSGGSKTKIYDLCTDGTGVVFTSSFTYTSAGLHTQSNTPLEHAFWYVGDDGRRALLYVFKEGAWTTLELGADLPREAYILVDGTMQWPAPSPICGR